jgi:hypothetical protein
MFNVHSMKKDFFNCELCFSHIIYGHYVFAQYINIIVYQKLMQSFLYLLLLCLLKVERKLIQGLSKNTSSFHCL